MDPVDLVSGSSTRISESSWIAASDSVSGSGFERSIGNT